MSGLILGGFGVSPVIYNLLAQVIVNPNNENPTKIDGVDKFYSDEIAEKVPTFFIYYMIISGFFLILSLVLIQIDGVYNKI